MYVYYTLQFLNKVMKILEHHQERLFLTACSWLKESANKMGEIESGLKTADKSFNTMSRKEFTKYLLNTKKMQKCCGD